MSNVMIHDGGGGPSNASRANSASFDDIEAALVKLREARASAVGQDWTEYYNADPLTRPPVDPQGTDLSEIALGQIESKISEHFAPHAAVPERLERDAERWVSQTQRLSKIRRRVAELRSRTGVWSGPAQQMFSTAAQVQGNALMELEGVLNGARDGCNIGAFLQRVVFYVAAREITSASISIRAARGGGEVEFFKRRAFAYSRLHRLSEVLDLIRTLSNVRDAANEAAQQLLACLEMPNLLSEGAWPSGVDMADVDPSDPSSAIDLDHEGDADYTAPVPAPPPSNPQPGEPV